MTWLQRDVYDDEQAILHPPEPSMWHPGANNDPPVRGEPSRSSLSHEPNNISSGYTASRDRSSCAHGHHSRVQYTRIDPNRIAFLVPFGVEGMCVGRLPIAMTSGIRREVFREEISEPR